MWCRDDLIAIAADIREKDTIDPDKLFGGSDAALPQQLKRKTRADLSTALSSIKEFLNEADDEDAPKCTVDSVLAALASEMYFMDTQKKKRDSAIDSLRKARSERLKVESYSSKLIAESKALSEQVARERTRRGKATEEKADSEKRLEQERKKLEAERSNYSIVRENMEKAKMSELDVRRRLDRMRLKVAAMRGEMVISTVDKLANPSPIWLGDTDESIISIDTDPKANRAEDTSQPAKGEEKQDVDMTEAQSGIESSTPSGSRDELELDEGQEETEFRLLKNRLAMCEMEAEEWRTTLDAEREKVRLILRAKTRLEEEFVRQKQGGINKSGGSGGRSVGKGAASNIRPAAKLRAAVRATIPCPPDIGARKAVRRSRKGRPRKALVGASN